MNAMEISRSGLNVEWERLQVIASNIANANTIIDANGRAYQAKTLLSGPVKGFAALLNETGETMPSGGAMVYSIEPQTLEPRRVYEPGHPQADEAGYVTYPGFDHAGEMMQLMKTSRAYEANVVAMNIARLMYASGLQIGGRNS